MKQHIILAATVMAAATLGFASGTRVGFQDAFAAGRANAFVATADDASAVYYNGAGLTQLSGSEVTFGSYFVSGSSKYSGAGGSASMDNSLNTVPQFFFGEHDKGSRWAYGIGAYAPFGLKTQWPANSPLSTLATTNKLTDKTIAAVLAYKVNDTLSLSAGVTYSWATLDLNRHIGAFSPTDRLTVSQKGSAPSFTLGTLWQPSPQHSFGLSYQHETNISYRGTTEVFPVAPAVQSSFRLPFPEVVIVGYAFKPTPEWNIEANIDWTDWGQLGVVNVASPIGAIPLDFRWKSGTFYEIGATRYFSGGWHASLGYLYTENSLPDAVYTPAVPDSNRSFYSAGFGFKNATYSIDLAYHFGDGGTRQVRGSPLSAVGATADGSYKNSLNGFAVTVGYRF